MGEGGAGEPQGCTTPSGAVRRVATEEEISQIRSAIPGEVNKVFSDADVNRYFRAVEGQPQKVALHGCQLSCSAATRHNYTPFLSLNPGDMLSPRPSLLRHWSVNSFVSAQV